MVDWDATQGGSGGKSDEDAITKKIHAQEQARKLRRLWT